MTTRRPYNTNHVKTPEEAFIEVQRCAGSQFDPRCAHAFVSVREKVVEAMRMSKATGTFYVNVEG